MAATGTASPSDRALVAAGFSAPYVATVVGLLWLESGWTALLLYNGLSLALLALGGRLRLFARVYKGWSRWGALAVVVTALAGPTLALLWPLIPGTASMPFRLSQIGLDAGNWWLFAAYFGVIHPVIEETHWRGWLHADSRRPHWRDAAFAGYHLLVLYTYIGPGWAVLATALIAGTSWAWRQLARMEYGLLSCVLSHAVADLSVMVAVGLLLFWRP